MRAIAGARADTHVSKFTSAIYRKREIIVFLIFVLLLLYISRKENVSKRGVHFEWKEILFELLDWMFKTALYIWLKFRKQIFSDFIIRPTEPK